MVPTEIIYTENLSFDIEICIIVRMNYSLLKVSFSTKEYLSIFFFEISYLKSCWQIRVCLIKDTVLKKTQIRGEKVPRRSDPYSQPFKS